MHCGLIEIVYHIINGIKIKWDYNKVITRSKSAHQQFFALLQNATNLSWYKQCCRNICSSHPILSINRFYSCARFKIIFNMYERIRVMEFVRMNRAVWISSLAVALWSGVKEPVKGGKNFFLSHGSYTQTVMNRIYILIYLRFDFESSQRNISSVVFFRRNWIDIKPFLNISQYILIKFDCFNWSILLNCFYLR